MGRVFENGENAVYFADLEMNLKKYYTDLYNDSIRKIRNGEYGVDRRIDLRNDTRFGVTLVIRPSSEVKNKIDEFLNDLKGIEPYQYYYPETDIHLTVLSIISCYENFNLSNINIGKYIEVIEKEISSVTKFSVDFIGITSSSSCIMIQGYPRNGNLKIIRDNLRKAFEKSDLEQSIDKRYKLKTAHSTVVRFKNNLNRIEDLISVLDRYRNHDFGSFEVRELELVYNDWYQRKEKSICLKKYELL